ncbi:MAG: hypothetical protein JKY92_02500 [Magnetovibrio sp.]|nr:hypothetical protein [Magnetovibrio sp.]
MSRKGWSQSTFEVQSSKGGRWIIEMSSSRKSEAMKCVEILQTREANQGIRVIEQKDDGVKEKVVFEKQGSDKLQNLKLNLVPDLEMCTVFQLLCASIAFDHRPLNAGIFG